MLHIRFKEARNAKGYSQAQLAEIINVSQSAVYKIELGETQSPRKLREYAAVLGVTEEWLRYGISENAKSGPSTNQPNTIEKGNAQLLKMHVGSTDENGLGLNSSALGESDRPIFVDIPVYDVSFSAGDGCFFEYAEVIDSYSISTATLERYNVKKANASVVKVKGESMEYTLNDGDSILLDNSITKPQNNKIFAFSFEGELKVKRFFHQLDRNWRISSDNEDKNRYQDEIIAFNNIDKLDIAGKVLTILDRSLA
jgi:phage repressor protein C with HTH and peptisase S24 domain